MKSTHLALLWAFLLGLNCERVTQLDNVKKTNFILYAGSRDSTSLFNIAFENNDTLTAMPVITINGTQPDTIEHGNLLYRARFKNFHADSVINYKIVLYNDSIQGHFIRPGEIDSLFCNNVFVHGNYSDTTTSIDTSSTYVFTWKTKRKGDYFSFEYYGDLNNNRDGSKYYITTDTFLTVIPEIKGLAHSFLKMKLENCNGNKNTNTPDMSSNKINIYYNIWPSRYTCKIYMSEDNNF